MIVKAGAAGYGLTLAIFIIRPEPYIDEFSKIEVDRTVKIVFRVIRDLLIF